MRSVPSADAAPSALNRYLLPNERQIISIREHPAVLIGPIALVLLGLALAAFLAEEAANGNGTVILVIWAAWGVLLLWLVGRVAEWSVHYFAVTSQRMMLAQGVVTHKVNMIPLAKVTDVEFRRTALGRFLGYGEFEILAPGMDDRMRHIRFVPYPEQLYLELCGLLFQDSNKDSGGE
jgi:membrane protein YdbS with pleckstrin-like domain